MNTKEKNSEAENHVDFRLVLGGHFVLWRFTVIHKDILSFHPVLYFSLLVVNSSRHFSQKEGNMGLDVHRKPLRLIRDGEVGGSGIYISNTYSLHCHHQNDSALRWAAV